MRVLKGVAVTALLLGAVYGFGRFFAGELRGGGGGSGSEPAGVQLAAPPGFVVADRGELASNAAARELAALLAERPRERRLGLRFSTAGAERYWLVERLDADSVVLTELAAGTTGTRVETTWRDTAATFERRLARAAAHGSLESPELPHGTSHNLYH